MTEANVAGLLEPEHRIAHLVGLPDRQAHARVAGELVDDVGIGERAVGAAAVQSLAMHQLAAVLERDLHFASVVERECRARVDLVVDEIAQAQDALVAQRLGLQLGEREMAAHEACRHQVGDRKLRIVGVGGTALVGLRLAHGLDDLRRHQRLDALDVRNRKLVLPDEGERGVRAGVGEMAGRQRLIATAIVSQTSPRPAVARPQRSGSMPAWM